MDLLKQTVIANRFQFLSDQERVSLLMRCPRGLGLGEVKLLVVALKSTSIQQVTPVFINVNLEKTFHLSETNMSPSFVGF